MHSFGSTLLYNVAKNAVNEIGIDSNTWWLCLTSCLIEVLEALVLIPKLSQRVLETLVLIPFKYYSNLQSSKPEVTIEKLP